MTDQELLDEAIKTLRHERNEHFKVTGDPPKAFVVPQVSKRLLFQATERVYGEGDSTGGLTVFCGVQVFGDREVVVLDYDGWELSRIETSGVRT